MCSMLFSCVFQFQREHARSNFTDVFHPLRIKHPLPQLSSNVRCYPLCDCEEPSVEICSKIHLWWTAIFEPYYRIVLGKRPPPNFDNFVVFHGSPCNCYHAKFSHSESKGPMSSHSCNCSDALRAPWHQASKVRTHLSLASFTAFLPCSMNWKRRLNAVET